MWFDLTKLYLRISLKYLHSVIFMTTYLSSHTQTASSRLLIKSGFMCTLTYHVEETTETFCSSCYHQCSCLLFGWFHSGLATNKMKLEKENISLSLHTFFFYQEGEGFCRRILFLSINITKTQPDLKQKNKQTNKTQPDLGQALEANDYLWHMIKWT